MMTKVAVTKLLLLLILAFIICLPEFFTQRRVLRLNSLCFPFRTCGEGKQAKKKKNGTFRNAGETRQNIFGSSKSQKHHQWQKDCSQDNMDGLDLLLDHRQGESCHAMNWFRCETDMNGEQNSENHSLSFSSAMMSYLEVSVELLLNETETLNLTLYGHSNHSLLHLHPPEEEEEENNAADKGQREAFFCCLPLLPSHNSANPSCCLLGITNQTIWTAMEKLPWKQSQTDEWQRIIRVVWLVLLLVVLLAIVMTVVRHVYKGLYMSRRKSTHHMGNEFPGRHLNDTEKPMKIVTDKGLSPIQEVDCQHDIETLSNGNTDDCFIT